MKKDVYVSSFKTMADSTVEHAKHIVHGFNHYLDPHYLTEFYSNLLIKLKHCHEGFPIDRFEHSLQTGTRAYNDGCDNEMVICALLHDVGEVFDPYHHDAIIAELLKNYISEKNYTVLRYHTTFQGYYYWEKLGLDKNAREQYKSNPYYQDCIDFVEKYDDKAFDTNYKSLSLDEFKPMLMAFFADRKQAKGSF